MRKEVAVIGGVGLAAVAVVGTAVALAARKAPEPEPEEGITITIWDDEGNIIAQNSPADVEEGNKYWFGASITNLSMKGTDPYKEPVAADLLIVRNAYLGQPPNITQLRDSDVGAPYPFSELVHFLAEQTLQWTIQFPMYGDFGAWPFFVPVGVAGQMGALEVAAYDPTGAILLDSGIAVLTITTAEIDYGATVVIDA